MVRWCFLYFFSRTQTSLLLAYHRCPLHHHSASPLFYSVSIPSVQSTKKQHHRAFEKHDEKRRASVCPACHLCWRSSFFFHGTKGSIGLLLSLPLVLSFRPLESPALLLLPRPCVHNECGSIFLYKYTTRNLACKEWCHAQKVSKIEIRFKAKTWCVQTWPNEGLKAHYLRLWAWMPSLYAA